MCSVKQVLWCGGGIIFAILAVGVWMEWKALPVDTAYTDYREFRLALPSVEASIEEIAPAMRVERINDPVLVLREPLPFLAPLQLANDEFADVEPEIQVGYFGSSNEERPMLRPDDFLEFFRWRDDVGGYNFESLEYDLVANYPFQDLSDVRKMIADARNSKSGLAAKIANGLRFLDDAPAAFQMYQRAAEETNAPACWYQVGAAQLLGKGTEKNLEEARQNLAIAFAGDVVEAGYFLGMSYLPDFAERGRPDLALPIFEMAIEAGSCFACGEAGRILEGVVGIPADVERAIALYEEGAHRGDRFSLQRLAILDPSRVPSEISAPALSKEELYRLLPLK